MLQFLKYIVLVCVWLLAAPTPTLSSEVQMSMYSTSYYLKGKRKINSAFYLPPQMVSFSSSLRTTTGSVSAASYHYSGSGGTGASGRFTTHVHQLSSAGYATTPGPAHIAARPKFVVGDGDDDDQYQYEEPNQDSIIAPVGDTPWILLLILMLTYIAVKQRKLLCKK